MSFRFSLFALSVALLLSPNATAKVVTVNNAESIARNFLVSKGISQDELVLLESTVEPTTFRAPSKDSESATYHIFSDKDKKEIIVVSGDDIARPILGYSFNYNADENGDLPPAMKDWLSVMDRQISQARKEGVIQSDQVAREWRAQGSVNVVKQLRTAKWGQNYPFCQDCPIENGFWSLAGCVPTSYAIMMKYYRYPSGAKGSSSAYYTDTKNLYVPSRTLSAAYDWDSMLMDYSGNYTYDQAKAVAALMADIGAVIHADYTSQSTAAYYKSGAIFDHFNYYLGNQYCKSDYSAQEWYSMLRNHIDSGYPVLYNAKTDDGSSGHSFIIDGYADQDYFCVNWGWAGSCDGAFALDAMNPSDGPNYSYNGYQFAFFDFQPAINVPLVAKINDSSAYPSLEAAVSVIPADGTPTRITLEKNTDTYNLVINKNQNIVLDLNGNRIEVVNYGFYNRGNLTITDSKGGGNIVFKRGNSGIISNYGSLTIDGGEYVNQVEIKEGENPNYRRCIWSETGSSTHIKGGSFKSVSAVICTNGKLTIDDGEFNCIGNESVISNYAVNDSVTINGGSFRNLTNATDGSNQRRVIWSRTETFTHITGGVFISKNTTVYSCGECIIDGGHFECAGNTSTLFNTAGGKMTINGGVFVNSGSKDSKDYRRALYSNSGTETYIRGGKFTSYYQVIAILGKAVIDDATVEHTGGGRAGILAGGGGDVTVNYCKVKAEDVLHNNNNSTLKCYGGIYSKTVNSNCLATGYKCVSNNDAATSSVYPYKVINPTGIQDILTSDEAQDFDYDMNGMISPDNRSGIHIIHKADGKAIKVLYR